MKTHQTLKVELTLVGPLLTSGGEMSDPGIDAPMARDRFGRFMLPFSLIKGKVLDAFTELRPEAFRHDKKTNRFHAVDRQLVSWLGLPAPDGSYDPERGRLRFTDFHTTASGDPTRVIERIRIDPDSGSVAGRMLQMVEAPFGYGEPVVFQGDVEFIADDVEAKQIAQELDQAFRWVPSYGAYRTVGFGRTQAVTVVKSSVPIRSKGTLATEAVLPMRLTLDRPLCVVGRKHSRNHFESQEVISGSVLKGAVAQMIQEVTGSDKRVISGGGSQGFPTLRKHFENIRFAEARPTVTGANQRPVEPPLSIVTSPADEAKDKYYDVALSDGPQLIYGAAPAFVPDWKDADFGRIRAAFGWPQLPKERRTRTAINPLTSRAADEQLFSYGLVLPDRQKDGKKESWVWEGGIGLEHLTVEDQALVRKEFQELLANGIVGIGKTRAVAIIEWLATPTPAAMESTEVSGDSAIITLQTEFLMTKFLMTNPDVLKSNSPGCLKAAYEAFWKEVSGDSIELTRYFARQSLYGGFLSQRSFGKDKYEPFLVTDRGSVFVLKLLNRDKATPLLEKWRVGGLPVPKWVQSRYSPDDSPDRKPLWQTCPFLPHAGYGEIAINLKCHTDPATKSPLGESA